MTMFAPKECFGGIFHAVLPTKKSGRCADAPQPTQDDFRYVDSSIRRFIMILDERGIQRSQVQIKIFGGAEVLPGRQYDPNSMSVGKRNVAEACTILKEMGLRITKADVGGTSGRKIIFDIHSGDVWLKRVKSSIDPGIYDCNDQALHNEMKEGHNHEG
jgi:chemotaxis protein CheD